ncbi:MAG: sodium/solute symporter [Bryobacterales bacterium]|nr:sodium/solute symporter [Bryobacterales bacterium]MEB2362476.1 sodium/solute symporter [Bryobacterales bacterium]
MRLAAIDFFILGTYVAAVLGIGYWLKDRMNTSEDFLMAGRSLPSWITGPAFMAANLGSLEIVGMIAMSAKYGIMTCHWYWLGAIPPMVFLSLFMIRFYYSHRIRSVAEYLRLRYDSRAHVLNAGSFLVVTILMSGINMYALALVCEQMLGWRFHLSIVLSAGVVVGYTFLGGLRSSIYNEFLQFVLIICGFAPLAYFTLAGAGGWEGLTSRLPHVASTLWQGMGDPATNPLGVRWYTIVIALMLVMGPSYWCTDFLLVQRALAAKDLNAARKTPLIAAFPKMLFPAFVVIPGMAAAAMMPGALEGNYNVALTELMKRHFGPGLMGLGFTALIASFMSGMAGNVTAFNTVWTFDLYQTYLVKNRPDAHYLNIGKAATIVGTALSISAAYIVLAFDNLMDYMQLIGTLFISPFFVVFLLGMCFRRITATAAFYGVIAAILAGLTQYLLYRTGVIQYPTPMAATLHLAVWEGGIGALVTVVLTLVTNPAPDHTLRGLVYGTHPAADEVCRHWIRTPEFLAAIVLATFIALNVIFW